MGMGNMGPSQMAMVIRTMPMIVAIVRFIFTW